MKAKKTLREEKNGFKIPSMYFENFEFRLPEKEKLNEFLKEENPSGFEVPDNYFSSFSVKKPIEKEPKTIPLYAKKKLRNAMAIAAILAIMFSVFTDNTIEINNLSAIEQAKIGAYLENHPSEFSFLENTFLENKKPAELKFSTLDENILLDYLTQPTSELSFVNY